MSRLGYDLHIHSCLSPCGDDDMTVNNLVHMAMLKELDVIALSDHNTTRNAAAAVQVGESCGVLVIPAMELTTSEEIHVICLMPDLDSAWYFEQFVAARRAKIPNRPEIFGHQYLLDAQDQILGEIPELLLPATGISIVDLPHIVNHYGGFAFPAHIEKEANGLLPILGDIPEECYFSLLEVRCRERLRARFGHLGLEERYPILTNSDAHYLEHISEREHFLDYDGPLTSRGIVEYLRSLPLVDPRR